jgi:hypothetical protein
MLTRSQIQALRLAGLGLSQPQTDGDVAALVAHLGAIQAQDYDGSLGSLGLRLSGSSIRQIQSAIASAQIVRSWPMRGTLHWMAAADVRWMLKLMTPRIIAASAGRHRQLELDAPTLSQAGQVLEQALATGAPVQRKVLLQQLEQAGISTTGQRGYHILGWCAQQGLICCGPMDGKQPTFVWLDAWVPNPGHTFSGDDALAEIARRFFVSHGPASVHDLARWTGLTLTQARRGLSSIQAELASLSWQDEALWFSPAFVETVPTAPEVLLLPGFDEYILGYKDRTQMVAAAYHPYLCPGNNGMFAPSLVHRGEVLGTWKRELKTRAVKIQIQPFAPLPAAVEKALPHAVSHYGAFWGLSADYHITAV